MKPAHGKGYRKKIEPTWPPASVAVALTVVGSSSEVTAWIPASTAAPRAATTHGSR